MRNIDRDRDTQDLAHPTAPPAAGDPPRAGFGPSAAPDGALAPAAPAEHVAPRAGRHAARRPRAAGAPSYTAALRDLRSAFALARRWSPLVVPLLLEVALLVIAAILARHSLGPALVSPGHLGELAAALLLLGALLGPALYAARSDIAWVGVLALGATAYVIVSALVLFGPLAALAAAVLLLAGGFAVIREAIHPVMEGSVHVTALFGRYNRTLPPGLNLLLPGERVLAILPTAPREYTTLPQRSATRSGETCRAVASVLYELVSGEAHRAVFATLDWERMLHRTLATLLREELAQWPMSEDEDDGPPFGDEDDEERLRRRVERRLDDAVAPWGVRIISVRLRDVILPGAASPAPPPSVAAAPAGAPALSAAPFRPPQFLQGALAGARAGEGGARPALAMRPEPAPPAPDAPAFPLAPAQTHPLPPLAMTDEDAAESPGASMGDAAGQPRWPAPEPEPAAAGDPPPEGAQPLDAQRLFARLRGMVSGWLQAPASASAPGSDRDAAGDGDPAAERGDPAPPAVVAPTAPPAPRATPPSGVLSPEALASAYEAVRQGRIGDPETVRRIAEAFARYAVADDADVPFDAGAAARILRQRAAALDLERGAPAEATPDPTGPPGPARRPPPATPPRDENVLRGG